MALTALTVLFLPITLTLQLGNRTAVSGERRITALLFAQEVIEITRAEVERWTEADFGLSDSPRIELAAPGGYQYRAGLVPVEKGLDELRVEVRWSERRGRGQVDRKVELSGLISRRGARKTWRHGDPLPPTRRAAP